MKFLHILALLVFAIKMQCVACGFPEKSYDDLDQTKNFVNFLFEQPIDFKSRKMNELSVEGIKSYYFKYDTQHTSNVERFRIFVPISLGDDFHKSFDDELTKQLLKEDLCANWLLLVQEAGYEGDKNFLAALKHKTDGNMVFIYKL